VVTRAAAVELAGLLDPKSKKAEGEEHGESEARQGNEEAA
jgi:hypothetical protein